MKSFLITLSLLTAVTSLAQSVPESLSDKGEIFQKITTSSGIELKKTLGDFYINNHLDKNDNYLLVNLAQHRLWKNIIYFKRG